mgnify:CR=1 FL=1
MYIHVRIFPKSKEEKILEVKESHFEVYVKEEAKEGKANKRLLEIIRAYFPGAREIKIVSGHLNPSKLLSVNLEEED